MAGCEIITKNVDSPPSLSITIPKTSDLVRTSKRWTEVQLPIDILLLAVRNEDVLSCYSFLSEVVRSYKIRLGHVYFGNLGKDGGPKLKVGLITCSEGGGVDPGGPAMAVKNAVEILQPKAVFCIGTCRGLYRDKTRLGDVVVPAKLTTYASRRMTSIGPVPCGLTTPLSSRMSLLTRQAGFGWKPPLENPEVREVTVHQDSELLSGPEQVESIQRRDELIGLYPNAIAVELDGDGVFAAAHNLKTEWVIIKGISGYADCPASLTEQWAGFASAMAASVMNNILSDPFVFEEWPHYQNAINCSQRTQNEGNVSVVLRSPPYLRHSEPMIDTTNRMPENPIASPPLVLKMIGRRIKTCSGCHKPITSTVQGFSAQDDKCYCFGRFQMYNYWSKQAKSYKRTASMRHFHLNPVCTQVQDGAPFQINSDKVEVSSSLRALIKERFSKDI